VASRYSTFGNQSGLDGVVDYRLAKEREFAVMCMHVDVRRQWLPWRIKLKSWHRRLKISGMTTLFSILGWLVSRLANEREFGVTYVYMRNM
jgi:hypothetical protein